MSQGLTKLPILASSSQSSCFSLLSQITGLYHCARHFAVWLSSEPMSPTLLLTRINFESLFRQNGIRDAARKV